MRKRTVPAPEALRRQRLTQIAAVYSRLKRALDGRGGKALAALERERARQRTLAEQEYLAALAKPKPKPKPKPGVKQTQAGRPHAPLTPEDAPRKLSHAKTPAKKTAKKAVSKPKASRFWKHFGQDDRPVPPWETEAGPHVDSGDYDDGDYEESMFADEEYSYDDFDDDWGDYEYSDTGYPDEDA